MEITEVQSEVAASIRISGPRRDRPRDAQLTDQLPSQITMMTMILIGTAAEAELMMIMNMRTMMTSGVTGDESVNPSSRRKRN